MEKPHRRAARDGEASTITPTDAKVTRCPPDDAQCQAVGIIVGDVTFDDGKAMVVSADKKFFLMA